MIQLDEAIYQVVKGEVATLRFTPTGIIPDAIVVFSNNMEGPDPADPDHPTYKITMVENPPAGHPCAIDCTFPTGTGKVTLKVSGSQGGEFNGPEFTPAFPNGGLDFRVRAPQADSLDGGATKGGTRKKGGASKKGAKKSAKKAAKKSGKSGAKSSKKSSGKAGGKGSKKSSGKGSKGGTK